MPGALPFPPFEHRLDSRRIGAWCLIVLLHLGLFYALTHGLARQVSAVIPNVVMAIIVPAESIPAAVKPQPKKIVAPVDAKVQPQKPALTPTIDFTPAPAVPSGSSPVGDTTPPVPSEPVAAAPAAAPASATPKTISGVEYVQAPRPEYPPVSRRNGEQGVVQLRVLINEHGRPERVEIATSSGSARLDEAAKKAVMRAVFKPYLENGWLLPVYVLLPIRFNLD